MPRGAPLVPRLLTRPAKLLLLAAAATGFCATEPFGVAEPGRPIAFVGARLLPVSGPPVEDGVLVVEGGRIVAVGPRREVRLPRGAQEVDLAGRTIIPGLVDTHSHVGGGSGGDGSAPIQPEVRILDAINPRDPGFRRAVAGGITTVNVMPGSGHLVSGQTLYLKPRGGRVIEDLVIPGADGGPLGGLKMANGTNSQGAAPFPGTRAKSAALVRQAFVKADEYRRGIKETPTPAATGGDEKSGQDTKENDKKGRDLGLEILAEALDGRRVVHFHTHRADDIATVLRLQREFGFKLVVQHGTESPLLAGELKQAGVPVSMTIVDAPGGKLEAQRLRFDAPAELERAGVTVAINTDDWITDSRSFLRTAALTVRGGMSREGALAAVTLTAARLLDLDGRVGSLEPGKDADFVVLDGDPFAVRTQVLQTWIEGKKVFDRSDPKDRLHALGGYGAGQPTPAYLCCTGGAE